MGGCARLAPPARTCWQPLKLAKPQWCLRTSRGVWLRCAISAHSQEGPAAFLCPILNSEGRAGNAAYSTERMPHYKWGCRSAGRAAPNSPSWTVIKSADTALLALARDRLARHGAWVGAAKLRQGPQPPLGCLLPSLSGRGRGRGSESLQRTTLRARQAGSATPRPAHPSKVRLWVVQLAVPPLSLLAARSILIKRRIAVPCRGRAPEHCPLRMDVLQRAADAGQDGGLDKPPRQCRRSRTAPLWCQRAHRPVVEECALACHEDGAARDLRH